MKKFSFLMSAVIALVSCVFFACSEDQAIEKASTTSVEFGLEITKSALIQTRAGALVGDDGIDASDEVPYCDESLNLDGYAVAEYSITFSSGREISGTWEWDLVIEEEGEDSHLKRLDSLRQIDFQDGETSAEITFSDFRVYDDAGNLKFITPKVGSAYEKYVETPVSYVFAMDNVDLYEKQYLSMDVLCFNEETIPLFGFAWTDFDIIQGDEVCMFFNCIDSTEAGVFHTVVDKSINAYFISDGEETNYWTGQTGSAMCIPCPGNWFNEEAGMKIVIDETEEIYITTAQIAAFLDPAKEEEYSIASGSDAYDLTVDFAGGIPFLHFYFKECSDLDGSEEATPVVQ